MTDTIVKDKPQAAEHSKSPLPDTWNYQTFKDYLLATSRGKEFRLPMDQMPQEIDLGQWNPTLNQMRDQTAADMKERYMMIGFKEDRNGLYLPNNLRRGNDGNIPVLLKTLEDMRMRHIGKMDGVIGDTHSHPRELPKRPLTKLESRGKAAFSLGDLFGIACDDNMQIKGVVEGEENLFILRTRESITTKAPSQKKFVETWYRKHGWTPLERQNEQEGESAIPGKDSPSIQELNKKVAREYGLVLYRGQKDQPLKRIYPEIPKPPTKNPFAPAK